MKIFFKIIGMMAVVGIFLISCDKKSNLPDAQYGNGTATVLSASTTSVSPKAGDSSNVVLTLNWTDPHYATASSTQKFIIEIDSAGRNFSKEITTVAIGDLTQTFTGNQLNTILAALNFAPGKPFSVDMRVTSSYGNNNEQYKSNVVTITVTPYLIPITLTSSITGPLTLSVANATNTALSFKWNASPYGADTINYALQVDTVGGNFAKPYGVELGTNLTQSYTVDALNSLLISSGVLGGATKNMEFRVVSYKGTNYTQMLGASNVVTLSIATYIPIPSALYLVGDVNGWSNPVATPALQFTKIDAVSYGIVANFSPGGSYLFLPTNGSWDHKYGGTSATGGTLLKDDAVPGSNTPNPATSGLYKIVVNFQNNTYTVTPLATNPIPASLFIVGDATPGGWTNPVPTPSQQFTQVSNGEYQLTLALTGGKSYLLLPTNGLWDHKFGGTSATGGTLLADDAVPGSNTPSPASDGTYLIDVNFLANTYTVTQK
ncbi:MULTISPECIES: SusE domain-containing protein [Chitinophagaceae]